MTVLTMKAMGINDLLNFDFMDPPPPQVSCFGGFCAELPLVVGLGACL